MNGNWETIGDHLNQSREYIPFSHYSGQMYEMNEYLDKT